MLGSLIIVFREVIEAGLIVGIVLAVTQGVHGSRATIVVGVVAGILGALLVAAFAGVIANALWMASHGRELAAGVKRVGDAVRTGSRSIVALGVVCAVAVMREGSEVALFMYGLVASGGSTMSELLAGSLLGLLAGAAVTAVTYLGLVKIPPRRLFAVTTVLISFVAAGLAAQAARFLQQAGVISALAETAWDTSAILSDTSILGRVLRTLIGYSDQPSVLQVVVYVATLAIIVALTKAFGPGRAPAPKARGAAAE
jgi:high-affinity iron transporter